MYSELVIALRSLIRAKLYTVAVVGSLALGLGSTASIYTAVQGTLFPVVPYRDPAELVRVSMIMPKLSAGEAPLLQVNFAAYRRANLRSLRDLVGARAASVNLLFNDQPVQVFAASVTTNFFTTLGVTAAIGRGFLPHDERGGTESVVVLGHSLWQAHFGSNPDVLGQTVNLEGQPYRVIGVLPRDVLMPNNRHIQIYRVLSDADKDPPINLASSSLLAFGRLQPGYSPAQAQAELEAIKPTPFPIIKSLTDQARVLVLPLNAPVDTAAANFEQTSQKIALGAVALLYLIAVANASSLMLNRMLGRRREFSVRKALGGGWFSTCRPLVIEGILIALLAIVLGGFVTKWLFPVILNLSPDEATWRTLELRWETIAALSGLALLSGLVVSAALSWHVARLNCNDALKENSHASESRRMRLMRNGFVACQAALAVALLVGTGLMVKSFQRIMAVDPGFKSAQRLGLKFSLPYTGIVAKSASVHVERSERILQALSALPDVREASITSNALPASYITGRVSLPDQGPTGEEIPAAGVAVSTKFFHTLGIRQIAGSDFTDLRSTDRKVAMINQTMVRKYFGGENPIGKKLKTASDQKTWEIIGVVGDVRRQREEPQPAYYFPYWQPGPVARQAVLHLQVGAGPHTASEVRKALWLVDPAITVMEIDSLDHELLQENAVEHATLLYLKVLGGLALVLTVIGLFSMMAYTVGQRQMEFGIRLAMGASPRSLEGRVIREGITVTAAGVLAGLAIAWGGAHLLQSQLYKTSIHDPYIYLLVAGGILLVAALASLGPARMALKVDPLRLLRSE